MATFLANEINITEEDITGSTAQVEIKDKKSRVFEDIFFWEVDESTIKESQTLCDITNCIEK